MRIAAAIELSADEAQRLERIERSNTTTVREARRAAIIWRAAGGLDNYEIAAQLGIGRVQVGR